MSTITFTGTLTTVECCDCHIVFGISPALNAELHDNHKLFYCPRGHSQYFPGKSDTEKLAEQLAREKRYRGISEAQLTSTRDQLHATERSLRGHKAAKTRIKNRIAAGQCPCCRRSFQNVERHMAGQHPDFAATESE